MSNVRHRRQILCRRARRPTSAPNAEVEWLVLSASQQPRFRHASAARLFMVPTLLVTKKLGGRAAFSIRELGASGKSAPPVGNHECPLLAMKVALQYRMGDTAGAATGGGYNRGSGRFDLTTDGTFTSASPSRTTSSAARQMQVSLARSRSGISSATITVTSTVSPIFTGARN